jgi:hypothetical protein
MAFESRAAWREALSKDLATELIAVCADLSKWPGSSPAAKDFRKAHAELGTAIGVFRNAALVFRSMDEVEGVQREARTRACPSLL